MSKRQANVELLRIVAMVMIVAHHFSVHGEFDLETMNNKNAIIIGILACGGKIGVNIFFLIMGYFSLQMKFKPTKFIQLIGLITFYSITIYIICVLIGCVEFRKKEVLYAFFPFLIGGGYWFTTTYLQLYLLSPLLKNVVEKINRNTFLGLISLGICCFTVMPFTIGRVIKLNDYGYSSLTWYILIFCIGAYIQKYDICNKNRKIVAIGALSISTLLFTYFIYFSTIGEINNSYIKIIIESLADYNENAIFVVIISILLFIVFLNLNVNACKLIYLISGSTFGIYLIHDNKNFSEYMWTQLCKTQEYQNSSDFILYAIVTITIVFIICSCIEIIRNKVCNIIKDMDNNECFKKV